MAWVLVNGYVHLRNMRPILGGRKFWGCWASSRGSDRKSPDVSDGVDFKKEIRCN